MDDVTAWKNARFDFQIVTEEADAVSATLVLKDEDNTYEFTQPFVDLVADFQSEVGITALPVADYDYMVYENYATGLPVAFPDPDNCDGECDLPTITICEAIEVS